MLRGFLCLTDLNPPWTAAAGRVLVRSRNATSLWNYFVWSSEKSHGYTHHAPHQKEEGTQTFIKRKDSDMSTKRQRTEQKSTNLFPQPLESSFREQWWTIHLLCGRFLTVLDLLVLMVTCTWVWDHKKEWMQTLISMVLSQAYVFPDKKKIVTNYDPTEPTKSEPPDTTVLQYMLMQYYPQALEQLLVEPLQVYQSNLARARGETPDTLTLKRLARRGVEGVYQHLYEHELQRLLQLPFQQLAVILGSDTPQLFTRDQRLDMELQIIKKQQRRHKGDFWYLLEEFLYMLQKDKYDKSVPHFLTTPCHSEFYLQYDLPLTYYDVVQALVRYVPPFLERAFLKTGDLERQRQLKHTWRSQRYKPLSYNSIDSDVVPSHLLLKQLYDDGYFSHSQVVNDIENLTDVEQRLHELHAHSKVLLEPVLLVLLEDILCQDVIQMIVSYAKRQ